MLGGLASSGDRAARTAGEITDEPTRIERRAVEQRYLRVANAKLRVGELASGDALYGCALVDGHDLLGLKAADYLLRSQNTLVGDHAGFPPGM